MNFYLYDSDFSSSSFGRVVLIIERIRPSTYSIARISSVLLRQIEKNHQDERRIESIERAGNQSRLESQGVSSLRYWLWSETTDMRKSFYSLSGLVRTKMGKVPLDSSVYVFINALNPLSAILHRRLGGGRSDCEDRYCNHSISSYSEHRTSPTLFNFVKLR